jgi:hypothetical protein
MALLINGAIDQGFIDTGSCAEPAAAPVAVNLAAADWRRYRLIQTRRGTAH